jgi:hypothetical protein
MISILLYAVRCVVVFAFSIVLGELLSRIYIVRAFFDALADVILGVSH